MTSASLRTRLVALVASCALTAAGCVALIAMPQPASADGVAPGVAPDFTLRAGDSSSKTFTKTLVGSAEVRPTPGPCREDPVIGLTCGAHRIKLQNRQPGYFLRISVSWLAQSASGTAVPDVDIYLFDNPETHLPYEVVGGASAAMPEQIKVADPAQDEYDLVVGAYAGAVTEYTVVAEYVNVGPGLTPAAADIVLSARQEFKKRVTTPMVGFTGQPVFYPLVSWLPDECRNDPTRDPVCDVYRLKLNRNTAKDAVNFIVIELTWDATYTPDLAVIAAGLGGVQDPNLDIMVWDAPDHELGRTVVGGQDSTVPERAAFQATQDEYDIVVQIGNGTNSDYTIRAYFSDEQFAKPFESLDEIQQFDNSGGDSGSGGSSFGDTGSDSALGGFGGSGLPDLDLAPINPDADIAGIGLGVSEQFDPEQVAFGGAARNTAATGEPPAGWVLVLALGVVPLAAAGGIVGGLRRRRHALV